MNKDIGNYESLRKIIMINRAKEKEREQRRKKENTEKREEKYAKEKRKTSKEEKTRRVKEWKGNTVSVQNPNVRISALLALVRL